MSYGGTKHSKPKVYCLFNDYSKLRTKHEIPGQLSSLEILFFSTSQLKGVE